MLESEKSATDSARNVVLRLNGITKRFGTLTANDNVSLDLARGEVLALLGENGAGKSTLVNILFGHYVADAGSIEVFGRPLAPGHPRAALNAGVGMVHQHFTLAHNLSVLDNVMIGTESLWNFASRRREAKARLVQISQQFGLTVNPNARVSDLSVGERQRVEILKALFRGAKILILDEPTAVLTPQESEALFNTLQTLVADGLSIIFISHKLEEVVRVSQRVAVLRQGRLIAVKDTANTQRAELAALMVGREVTMPKRDRTTSIASAVPVLRVSELAAGGTLKHASFDVAAGEIFGIAGVSGNGQAQLADVLNGLVVPSQGQVLVGGRRLPATPARWIAAGVARVPEDRANVGIVGDLALWENAIAEHYREPAFSGWGVINCDAAKTRAKEIIERFDVRGGGTEVRTRSLSGGNMQKLVLGRVLIASPKLIVANQPTWGLDVGAVSYVHTQLLEARNRGVAVMLISEDLDELFALCDRIAVMFHGVLSEARTDWALADIGLAMAGGREAERV